MQQAGNFLDETLAPHVAHYVTASACPAPPVAASSALGLAGTPCPGASHCRHTAPGLSADPRLTVHRSQCRNKAPPAWPPSSPGKATLACLQCMSLGSGAASAAAWCRGRAGACHGTLRADGQTGQDAKPRGAQEVSSLCCLSLPWLHTAAVGPGIYPKHRAWSRCWETSTVWTLAALAQTCPTACAAWPLHRGILDCAAPSAARLCRQHSSIGSTALSAALRAHSRAAPAPAVLGGRRWLRLSCFPASLHCGPSFPAVTLSKGTGAW